MPSTEYYAEISNFSLFFFVPVVNCDTYRGLVQEVICRGHLQRLEFCFMLVGV